MLKKNLLKLRLLKVANNHFTDIKQFKVFSEDCQLELLNIIGNPLAEQYNIHQDMMALIPTLNTLDGKDREGEDRDTDELCVNDDHA